MGKRETKKATPRMRLIPRFSPRHYHILFLTAIIIDMQASRRLIGAQQYANMPETALAKNVY
jgi:hypothetical protein